MNYKFLENHPGITKSQYVTYHLFINKNHKKQGVCDHCKSTEKKRYEWALIKGRSYSKNIEDYIELCASCHRKYDVTDVTKAKQKKRMTENPPDISKTKINTLSKGKFESDHVTAKAIFRIDKLTGDIIQEYGSLTEAKRLHNYTLSHISQCLTKKIKTAYGFKWEYKNKEFARAQG